MQACSQGFGLHCARKASACFAAMSAFDRGDCTVEPRIEIEERLLQLIRLVDMLELDLGDEALGTARRQLRELDATSAMGELKAPRPDLQTLVDRNGSATQRAEQCGANVAGYCGHVPRKPRRCRRRWRPTGVLGDRGPHH